LFSWFCPTIGLCTTKSFGKIKNNSYFNVSSGKNKTDYSTDSTESVRSGVSFLTKKAVSHQVPKVEKNKNISLKLMSVF